MELRGERIRFWLPVALLALFASYIAWKLVTAHLEPVVREPRYGFEREIPSIRGGIYGATADPATGRANPIVKSTPCWEFRLDPVAMTNGTVRMGREKPRTREAMARTVAQVLKLDYRKVLAMANDTSRRYQRLAVSSDGRARDILCDRRFVAGVIAEETHERRYFEGPRLAHVIDGIEKEYNALLRGAPGRIRGMKDGGGREIVEKRIELVEPSPGADVYLTIDRNVQKIAEEALADGVAEYGAAAGWCIVMDAASAKILAMASFPSFDPGRTPWPRPHAPEARNRAIALTYEPGSVMKPISVAAAMQEGFATLDTLYSTDRQEKRPDGTFKYYRLPGDAGHVWEPKMTVRDAIVHSSNIVIGKLGYDLGPKKLHACMRRFGFGALSGIELPGEERGILRRPEKWDLATRSRAAIGQGITVTAIQLISAYQALANDGVRVPPRIVERICGPGGAEMASGPRRDSVRAVSVRVSRQLREAMLGVAAPGGTARRAAIKGYSIAGKTGTAQKVVGRTYAPGLYRATFCGIVPSGVVKADPADAAPVPPRIVALVTLDFDERRQFHQGGNSAGPVFRRIAQEALRLLEARPDRPEEIIDDAE